MKNTIRRSIKALALVLPVLFATMPDTEAQTQSSQLQFDLRTGGDPFTFPPHRAVPIRIHTLFGTNCAKWDMEVRSSSLTGGVQKCIAQKVGSNFAECTVDTGSAQGPKQVHARCTTPDGRVLERTQLISVRTGVAAPADSYPFGAPAAANASASPSLAAAPAAAPVAASSSSGSAGGAALAAGVILAGTAAAVGLAAAASGGGSESSSSSGSGCPTGRCSGGGGFCQWPANCPCPTGSTGVGGSCPASFGGTPTGTKHCLC